MNIAFLAAEAEPFIKVGGLGDVAGSLPLVLRSLSADIRIIMPLHGAIRQQGHLLENMGEFKLQYYGEQIKATAYTCLSGEVPVYFIDHELLKTELPVYSRDDRVDGARYGIFAIAALDLIKELGWNVDILHANDWHTALAVYGLYQKRQTDPFFENTKSIISIHNLPYMGADASDVLAAFSLPKPDDILIPVWARNRHLPLGLLAADRIVAVSPTYASEIMTPEFGSGLEIFLQSRSTAVSGILNGISCAKWDPARDTSIQHNYEIDSIEKRTLNRIEIQRSLDLTPDPEAMVIGMISRMDYQKGADLIVEALYRLPLLLEQPVFNWQLVVLGTGDALIEADISRLQRDFPNRVRVCLQFDQHLSRQIYASADLLLIPSRYEPCGLTQMIGMRYGCVPLGRATGGLIDTIRDFDESAASTGFLFQEASSEALLETLLRAMKVFQQKDVWKELQLRGMKEDFSWEHSALQYMQLYEELTHNLALVRTVATFEREESKK